MKDKNKYQRGQREQFCLDSVLSYLFKTDDRIATLIDGRSVFDLSDDDYPIKELCILPFVPFFFGFFADDIIEIQNALLFCKDEFKAGRESKFPDFVTCNGFIEHFAVTASKENKQNGGSPEHRALANDRKQINQIINNMVQNGNDYGMFLRESVPYSYDNFVTSFSSTWKHHIDSLNKYDGNKSVGIFMIDFDEYSLEMRPDRFANINIPKGMKMGDVFRLDVLHEDIRSYRLSRDSNLLNFIYDFRDSITYVIVLYADGVEFIKVCNIPYLLQSLPCLYSFAAHSSAIVIHKVSRQ